MLVLRSVPRDLHLAGCQLVVNVVNAEGDHDNQPQDQPQDQGQGFLQLLPLVHRALVFCRGRKRERGAWVRRCRAELLPQQLPVTAPRRTEPPAEPWGGNQLLWSKEESVTTQGCRERLHLSNQPTHWKNTFMPISSTLSATQRRPRWRWGSQSPSFLSD